MVNLALCVAGEQPPAWWGGQEWGWPGLLLSCNLHSLSRQFQRADVLEHQLKIMQRVETFPPQVSYWAAIIQLDPTVPLHCPCLSIEDPGTRGAPFSSAPAVWCTIKLDGPSGLPCSALIWLRAERSRLEPALYLQRVCCPFPNA